MAICHVSYPGPSCLLFIYRLEKAAASDCGIALMAFVTMKYWLGLVEINEEDLPNEILFSILTLAR